VNANWKSDEFRLQSFCQLKFLWDRMRTVRPFWWLPRGDNLPPSGCEVYGFTGNARRPGIAAAGRSWPFRYRKS